MHPPKPLFSEWFGLVGAPQMHQEGEERITGRGRGGGVKNNLGRGLRVCFPPVLSVLSFQPPSAAL